MTHLLRLLSLCLLALVPTVLAGQHYRPLTAWSDFRVGESYLLGAFTAGLNVHVLGAAEGAEAADGVRPAVTAEAGADSTFLMEAPPAARLVAEVVSGSGTKTRYRLRDAACGHVLCYTTKPTGSSTRIPLLVLPEEEVEAPLSCEFFLNLDNPLRVVSTADLVRYSANSNRRYYVRYEAYNGTWGLYYNDLRTTAVQLFRPVTPPGVALGPEPHTATFSGDWTAEALAGLDWSGIATADFTAATLPASWEAPTARVALTYVAEHQVRSLPPGWRNVAVVPAAQEGTTPTAVAADGLHWEDGDTLVLTYPVAVPAGQTVSYERAVSADGGHHSFYLPFDASGISVDGTPLATSAWQLWQPEACDEAGVHCRRLSGTVNLPAYAPFLMRPAHHTGDVVRLRFESGAQTIAPAPKEAITRLSRSWTLTGTLVGFRPTVSTSCYALDATGQAFVKAEAGSHIRPFRMLIRPLDAAAVPLRLPLMESAPTGLPETFGASPQKEDVPYRLDGRPAPRKEMWPKGIYVGRGRKFLIP